MKTELLSGEELLIEGVANLFRGWEGVGGTLYVTNRRVVFESHGLNLRRGNTEIPMEDIADARPRNNLWIVPNGMEVLTRDGVRHRFVLWGRQRLIDMIHVCKSGTVWGGKAAKSGHANTPSADTSIQTDASVEGIARKRKE